MRNEPKAKSWRFWMVSLCASIAVFFVLGLVCTGVVAMFNWMVQSGQGRWLVAAFPMVLGLGLLTMSVAYAIREYVHGDGPGELRASRRRPVNSVASRTGTHYVRLRTPLDMRSANAARTGTARSESLAS